MKRLFALLAVSAMALPAAAQLTVSYQQKSLAIAGASPRGDVAVYGAMHGNSDGRETVRSQSSITAADASGNLTVDVSTPAFHSIWLVVDLRSGSYLISTPPGYVSRRQQPPTDGIDPAGRSLSHGRPIIDVFVARRGAGAWRAHSAAGSENNSDPRRGHSGVNVQSLRPVGSSPPAPPHLVPGDIVIAIDTTFFEYWAVELTPAHLPGVSNAH
jgi:hypothetical protein